MARSRTTRHLTVPCAGVAASLTFEQLLIKAGMRLRDIEKGVVVRANIMYGLGVMNAVSFQKPDVALEAYQLAKQLPSTTTVASLGVDGYQLNGPLFEGSDLTICYKGGQVYILKGLSPDEAARAHAFQVAVAGAPVPHVTPFELRDPEGGKHFMIMPKYATTLEPMGYLPPACVAVLWHDMQEALDSLHAKGFVHADVKPSNICLDYRATEAILIDLGSVVRAGERTSSTPAYVPRDLRTTEKRASVALDWWMLAMTLAEKACGEDHRLKVGEAGVDPSKGELRDLLAAFLDPVVWAALEPKLV